MYIERTVEAGKILEKKQYFANRLGIHDKRNKKVNPSPECMKKANRRRAEEEIRWRLNANFHDRTDALVTFSYGKNEKQPEGYEGLKKDQEALIRSLRGAYTSHGYTLKYLYCMEIGPKGSRHIHMVLSEAGNLPPILLESCWGHGVVDVKPLNTDGDYKNIAAYFTKYSGKTEETTGEKLGRCFNCSRNVVRPQVKKRPIREKDLRKDPVAPEGYYLDKDSLREGISEFTGRPFREYVFHRLVKKTAKMEKTEHKLENDRLKSNTKHRKTKKNKHMLDEQIVNKVVGGAKKLLNDALSLCGKGIKKGGEAYKAMKN